MRRALPLLVAVAVLAPAARAQVGTIDSVPVPRPERPFLLVDAPRRYRPTEPARVRVQLREGGRASLALFRVARPSALLGRAGARQGISVAQDPIGAEAERLVHARGPLPRRGAALTLVHRARVEMPRPHGPRRVFDEATVYDSNEDVEDGVATYWVASERWSVRELDLGRLPAGLYLAQVRAAAWVASALVSVGELVVIARRGDREDIVWVSDANGASRAGVEVRAEDGATVRRARTDARGLARFASASAGSVRFVAQAGDDLAWTDVAHVRLDRCDPRVYLATGRPLLRRGEAMHVRGHVRGCDASGAYVGLAGRALTVRTWPDASVAVRSDADGNFVVELPAGPELVATLDGRAHARDVRIDDRVLPTRDLVVTPDRAWAVSGEVVTVRVADLEGGWPHPADVVLETPRGRLVGAIGPGAPAVFHVPVPPTAEALERMTMRASLSHGGVMTTAEAELFIGRAPIIVRLGASTDRGDPNARFPITLALRHLDGSPRDGAIDVAVYGSDGNRRRGEARHRARVDVEGARATEVPLVGEGPWVIEARRGASVAQQIVWARARPPSLSDRGPLAVVPVRARVRPGERLGVHVRLPPGHGKAWLTLEQGGVIVSRAITERRARIEVAVPDEARGLASLVLAHVEGGRVRTASAAVEVETSRPMTLTVSTDRTSYPRGHRAQITIEGRSEGRPRDAVVSLWLADAGYWSLGEETHPLPAEYLRLPGRPASGADSSRPVTYGSEEGRVLDAKLEWDGERMPESSHRHGWGFGGELVHRLRARGEIEPVLARFARAAGFPNGALVEGCGRPGEHRLVVHDLPWDLVATRLGDHLGATVSIEAGALSFDCYGASGSGLGVVGSGRGAGGLGMGTIGGGGVVRAHRLEGLRHFVGLARLGPDGALTLEVPLPDHPGRWRVEVLAIADDGGGARAHAVVHTRQALEAGLEVPAALGADDEVGGAVVVAGRAGAEVAIAIEGQGVLVGLDASAPAATISTRVTLDAQGRARLPLIVRATTSAPARVLVRASSDAGSDDVMHELRVLTGRTRRALRASSVIGAAATEVDVPLPALAAPATLSVRLPETTDEAVAELLTRLRAPRWDWIGHRLDRLASLLSLRRARGARRDALDVELAQAITGELHAIAALHAGRSFGGGRSFELEAGLLLAVAARDAGVSIGSLAELRDDIARRDREGTLTPVQRAQARLGSDALPDLGAAGLDGALRDANDDPRALGWIVRAASLEGAARARAEATARLARWVEQRLVMPPPACASPLSIRCAIDEDRVARAALVLVGADPRAYRALAARTLEWLGRAPALSTPEAWGTVEADRIALFVALAAPPGVDRYHVYLDGRRVYAPRGRVAVPAGSHRLTLRFAERADRARLVRVEGEVAVAPPPSALGDVALTRELVEGPEGWAARITFTLPRAAARARLRVPVGAGFSVYPAALPELRSFVDGAVELELRDLPAGRRELLIPLVVTAEGRFGLGPAELATDDGAAWGLTAPLRVTLAATR